MNIAKRYSPYGLLLISAVLLTAGCDAGDKPNTGAQIRTQEYARTDDNGADGVGQSQSTAVPRSVNKETQTMSDVANLPTCDDLLTRVDQGALPDELFQQYFPKSLEAAKVDAANFTDADMDKIAMFLSCSADLNDYDANVADNALALFTSAKHKAAAYAALDRLAKKEGEEGGYATRFAEQMRGYNDGPNG